MLELHVGSEPDRAVAGVRTEESAGLRGSGDNPEVGIGPCVAQCTAPCNWTKYSRIGRARRSRVGKMRSVGQAEGVCSYRQLDLLLHAELAQKAQVHVEVTRAAELVAVGVSKVRIDRQIVDNWNIRRCE